MPVSATAKFAPDTATRARRNFSRRWSRAASASSAGTSDRPAGAGRPTLPISSMKMSRISARLRWMAGTRMCDGRSWPSWTIISARSVSQTSMPSRRSASLSSISCVAIDLTLTTSAGAVVVDDRGDDRVRLGRVACPVDGAAGSGHALLESLEEGRQVAHDLVLDRRPGEAERLPVGPFLDDRGALGPDRRGRSTEVRAELAVRQGRLGRLGERRCPPERRLRIGRVGVGAGASRSRVRARRRQDLGEVHDPDRRTATGQQPADVHQARRVARGQDVRAGTEDVIDLVEAHRDRRVGVLDRERATEPATRLGPRQVDQRQAVDRAAAVGSADRRPRAGGSSGRSGGRRRCAGSAPRRRSPRGRRRGTRSVRRPRRDGRDALGQAASTPPSAARPATQRVVATDHRCA